MTASDRSAVCRVGLIGAGLMGRELASAAGRWHALDEAVPLPRLELVAVCDTQAAALDWFQRVPSVRHRVTSHRALLELPEVDAVYMALPHNLHAAVCLDVLRAGRDLLAEKPFGIDRAAACAIREAARAHGRFVRCSSEFPFLPGAQEAIAVVREGGLGRVLEIRAGFWHASDLDPRKPANWKRSEAICGAIGVMGDLGMHVVHIPFRLGLRPHRIYAQLQKGYPDRPDGRGGRTPCDTWDNALLHGEVLVEGQAVPIRFEMKRMAPGETNTWFFEVLGTDGGVTFSTKDPKRVRTFRRDGGRQIWAHRDVGHETAFKTVTGSIFEAGFPDAFLQMWAAFVAERAGQLGERLGCVTPDEAVASHGLFEAALQSHLEQRVVPVNYEAQ